MKRAIKIIPAFLLLFLCGAARDINNSFRTFTVGLVVADSTSLNATYEKPIYRSLKLAGNTVKLIDDSRLTQATYDGVHNFSTLSCVIIPNFVKVASIDTSVAGGIGEVNVLCLEDSLFQSFGFISNMEPYIYIADYGNTRIIKTQWDGANWKTSATGGVNRRPYGISLGASASLVQDTSYVYFTSYAAVTDTIIKRNWSGSSTTKYGTAGSGTGNFNSPRQIHVYDSDAATFNMLVGDDNNSRMVDTKYGSSGSWRNVTQGNDVSGVYKTTNYYFYQTATKLYRGTTTASAPTDSMTVSGTFGKHMYADNSYVFVIEGASPYKIYKISTTSFTKLDSLTSSKIGVPQSVWYDTRTGYLYWLTGEPELKRAKFDGTSDGADLDSCFASGSGVNQINSLAYGGIVGYPPASLATLNDDTLKVRTVTDSVTSIFTVGSKIKVYSNNGSISAMDTTSFYSTNMLCKTNAGTYAAVVIDTLNNKKRIAFGLTDPTKLTNIHQGGWTLFNRCLGRLVGADQDSVFSVGMFKHIAAPWPYEYQYASDYSSDSAYKNYLEINMHRLFLIPDVYGDSSQYRYATWSSAGTKQNWSSKNLYVIPFTTTYTESLKTNVTTTRGIFDLGNNLGVTDFNALTGDTIKYLIPGTTHPILTDAGLTATDTLNIFSTLTYPYVLTYPDDEASFGLGLTGYSTTGWVNLLSQGINSSVGKTLFVNRNKFWASLGLGELDSGPENINFYNIDTDYWTLNKYIFTWLTEKNMLFSPSGVTATSLNDTSIVISWTDNSTDEDGFNVYLSSGGNYTGDDLLLSTVGSGVTADTVSGLWGPKSLWYFEVGSYRAGSDTMKSLSPDSAYTKPRAPSKPIVYAVSDTALQVVINGYKHYDLFNDTTLATNPTWARIAGSWSVEKNYRRLKSGATNSTISTKYDSSSRDIEVRALFHFNDSLYLSTQWVKFYFTSSNNAGTGNGYYVYADSSVLQVRKQTGGVDADTLYNGTYTGDFKWHTLKVTNSWSQYPSYKAISWELFLDGTSQGTWSDTTYQKVGYVVLKSSHRRQNWDNCWIKHYPYPSANGSTTQYALQDSISLNYFNYATGDTSLTAVWGTYSNWGGDSGTEITVHPHTAYKFRVKAK